MDTGGTQKDHIDDSAEGRPPRGQFHDAVLRDILSRPENAGSEIRSVLPPEVTERLDLKRLEPQPGTFIDDELRHSHVDLLLKTTYAERDAYVYVLIEHQRTSDRLMAFRLYRYQSRIWDAYLKENTGDPKSVTLPLIIPIVIYQGDRRWTAPTDIAELLDVDDAVREGLGDLLPKVRYYLDDLTKVDAQALRARPLTPTVQLTFVALQRGPGDPDFTRWLVDWIDVIRQLLDQGRDHEVLLIFTYLDYVSDTPTQRLTEFAGTINTRAQEIAVTTSQKAFTDGRIAGMTEGRAEGRAEMLLQSLEIRFGELTEQTRTRVTNGTVEQLDTWNARFAAGAQSLDEVFA